MLLERLGLPFLVVKPEVEEAGLPGESAEHTALRLAESKARAVAGQAKCPALIIGSDQVALLEGIRLDKPGDHATAARQLAAMRSRTVIFHTAVCLLEVESGRLQCANVPTTVTFRNLSDLQIERYLMRDRPYDCAGSARIEGLGIALASRVESSDPSALIGLPLIALISMLKNEGMEVI
jgi:septum formation protein